ncbi:E3 ubiquitin-protein ligase TRIM71-like [Mercenaria mercenaria]|uniref:E3 ubiquitin-protein ligase TRIM71-like n=1 Tax=Mercenaria mercenaria TaxID=6596 RepID=UPI00234EB1BF|nr:E3 ubiquitin-protein ligase TRIM71-like [Mercenaria mercenaria]
MAFFTNKKETKLFPSATASMSYEKDLKVYCQPCAQDGPRIPAHGYCKDCQEHLCEACFAAHKRHKLSKHHTILDKNNMPKTLQLPSTSNHPSQPDDLTKPCPKHTKEMIKFYCHDHKVLLCSVCVTLEHTVASCNIKYIPDISSQIINSKEYQDILKTMDTITDQCQKMSEDVKNMTSKSNSSLVHVLADIKKFRKEINQRLDELEKQAEDAAKKIQQDNEKNLKTVKTKCDDVTKSVKTLSDSIKHLNTSKQADRLFIELQSAKKMIEDYEQNNTTVTAYHVKRHIFKQNEAIATLIEKEKSFGTLIKKALQQTKPTQDKDVKPTLTSHQGNILLQTSRDESGCSITGMALLTPDLLVITDWNNKAIKLVDTSSQSVADQLQLDTSPFDVTSVTSTDFVVTLPDQKTIQFISVSFKKLKKKDVLKTDGNCYGISCYQEKFVVSFVAPAKFQVFDMNGDILTIVNIDNTLSYPLHVTTNSHSIYVSDCNMKAVTRFDWQGEGMGSYCDMDEPHGISLSGDGSVFVCDYTRNAIVKITGGDCSNGKVVSKDLKGPYAVCWCAVGAKLYYSCDTADQKYDNFLQVLKLS